LTPIYLNSFCCAFRLNDSDLFLPDFTKHLFRSHIMRTELIKTANGVTRFNASRKQMVKIKIPIPPLSIQQEIVKILDATQEISHKLTQELSQELTLRKQQYAYYREQLLSFPTENNTQVFPFLQKLLDKYNTKKIEWKELGEVVSQVERIKWDNQGNKDFNYIDLSSVDREKHEIINCITITKKTAPSRAQQIVKENDVIFGTTRPQLKRYCLIPKNFDGQIASTGYCVLRSKKDFILPNYLYHFIGTEQFYRFVVDNEQGATYPAISDKKVKQFKIPIPPLEVQREIVKILDKFEKLTSELVGGIPHEIKLRQQQYEYYREKLLTFEELKA